MTCEELKALATETDFHPDKISDEQLVDIYCHCVQCKDCQKFMTSNENNRKLHRVKVGPHDRFERIMQNPEWAERLRKASEGADDESFLMDECKTQRAFVLSCRKNSMEFLSWPEDKQQRFRKAMNEAGEHMQKCQECREWMYAGVNTALTKYPEMVKEVNAQATKFVEILDPKISKWRDN